MALAASQGVPIPRCGIDSLLSLTAEASPHPSCLIPLGWWLVLLAAVGGDSGQAADPGCLWFEVQFLPGSSC